MEKEIKITPPEGFEIDKENSTFEFIKFKPIVKNGWRYTDPKVGGYYLSGNKIENLYPESGIWDDGNHDVFSTEKQAKSALALAQISQIIDNDNRFGGPITDEEFKDESIWKYAINRNKNKIKMYEGTFGIDHFLSFHTPTQRDLFLKEN